MLLSFDNTTPTRTQLLIAAAFSLGLLLVAIGTSPLAYMMWNAMPSFVPGLLIGVIITDILTAYIVFVQFAVVLRPALVFVAAAYLFSACMLALYLAAFPGVISTAGLFRDPSVGAWYFLIWHLGFPTILVAGYVLQARGLAIKHRARTKWIALAVFGIVGAAATSATILVFADPHVPQVLSGTDYSRAVSSGIAPTIFGVDVAALIYLLAGWFRDRARKSPMYVWLCVSVLALILEFYLTMLGGKRFSIGWYIARIDGLIASSAVLAMFVSEVTRIYCGISARSIRLRRLAYRDRLTGLANRHAFDERLAEEWERAARAGYTLSIVFADVDEFKRYNDTYGHQAGDCTLKKVAEQISAQVTRPFDLAARFGGEEFVILLPHTDGNGAYRIAEKMRHAIESLAIEHTSSTVSHHVTSSFGVAALVPSVEMTSEEIIKRADLAVYMAKRRGRNRAVLY